MIKLSDGCYVAADQVAEVNINDYRTLIIVRTKDGIGHKHEPAYGESIFDALDKLVKQINDATA